MTSDCRDEEARSVLGKRSREWGSSQQDTASEILARQIDLEIALRERTAEAANAKIAWAQAMQNAVFKGSQVSAYAARDKSGIAFQRESLQTLRAISLLAPSLETEHTSSPEIGVAKEEELTSMDITTETRTEITSTTPPSPPIEPPKSTPPIAISGKPLFIYQQAVPGAPYVTLLIACETCGRSDFLTVHSVLNHARLSHGVLYRNHEECIECCGQVVTGPEALRIRRDGTMATGQALPGMRKLIELAFKRAGSTGSDLLYQTLGLHADSPALATYLGKTIQKKQIRVFEPEDDIDVVFVDEDDKTGPMVRRWRPPFVARIEGVTDSNDDPTSPLGADDDLPPELSLMKRSATLGLAGSEVPASRFHIKRRIIITDWSRQIPQSQHTEGDAQLSHQWMVSITSPSYSNHITTFLSRLSISSGSDPPPCFVSGGMLSTGSPPYSISGTTDRPFLAHIKLEWVGGPTKPLEVDHWVRLTPFKGVLPRMGEEQTLDVELDRSTQFRAEIFTPQLSWDIPLQKFTPFPQAVKPESDPIADSMTAFTASIGVISPFESVLRSLMQGIPFTLEDNIPREFTPTELNLPKSREAFLSFVDGRRKAYEFRYVRTLYENFQKLALTDPALLRTPIAVLAITPGALYRWLFDQEYFPRLEPPPSDDTEEFCGFCGLSTTEHPSPFKLEDAEHGSISNVCREAHASANFEHVSAVNVHAWLASIMGAPVPPMKPPSSIPARLTFRRSTHHLVQSVDPRLVDFVQDTVSNLRLPFFRSVYTPATTGHIFPLDQLGQTIDEVDNTIVPYSFLAHILRLLVRDLVQGGISVARATAARVRAKAYTQRMAPLGYHPSTSAYHYPHPAMTNADEHSPYLTLPHQVLTPSHILRSLESGSLHMARLRMAVSRLSVANTGFALGHSEGATSAHQNSHNHALVKEEPDWE